MRALEGRVSEGTRVVCWPCVFLVSWDHRLLAGLAQYCPLHRAKEGEALLCPGWEGGSGCRVLLLFTDLERWLAFLHGEGSISNQQKQVPVLFGRVYYHNYPHWGKWDLPAGFKPIPLGADQPWLCSVSALTDPAHCSLSLSVVVIVTRLHCPGSPLFVMKGLKLLTGTKKPVAKCIHGTHPGMALPVQVWLPNALESKEGPVPSTRVNDLDFLPCSPPSLTYSMPSSVTDIIRAGIIPQTILHFKTPRHQVDRDNVREAQ